MRNIDEIIEFIQLNELVNSGNFFLKEDAERLDYLSREITREDVESVSLRSAELIFGNNGICTNTECKFPVSTGETCDICYYPTLRLV